MPYSPKVTLVPPLAAPDRSGLCCLRCLVLRGMSMPQPSLPVAWPPGAASVLPRGDDTPAPPAELPREDDPPAPPAAPLASPPRPRSAPSRDPARLPPPPPAHARRPPPPAPSPPPTP